MERLTLWIQAFAQSVGGPGLLLIAFLDSSFLSLPEINDILIVWMVTRQKERMVYYATMATVGSIAGCLLLYVLGRMGGEAVVRRRFSARRVDGALRLFNRYGVLAVVVPALLPPPAPFKIFVLLAGVARMRPLSFVGSIALGRGLRYFGEGLLAVRYGDAAIEYIRENGPRVSLIVALSVLLAGVAFVWWRRRQGPEPESTSGTP